MHAWNDQEAIIVAVAAPAIILKTLDGGASWNQVYENADTAMFLDAINFKDENNGSVVGDPINNIIFLFQLFIKVGTHNIRSYKRINFITLHIIPVWAFFLFYI